MDSPRSSTSSPRTKSTASDERLPPIAKERVQVPAFSIDISEEQRLKKLRTFNDTVIQTNDVNLHGLGYSEDFVAFVEQNLIDVKILFFIEKERMLKDFLSYRN